MSKDHGGRVECNCPPDYFARYTLAPSIVPRTSSPPKARRNGFNTRISANYADKSGGISSLHGIDQRLRLQLETLQCKYHFGLDGLAVHRLACNRIKYCIGGS